jgi:phage terminase large subunit
VYESAFDALRQRYAWEPGLFVREVLGEIPDPWQDKVLKLVAQGKRKISIRSGHGVGKTTLLAWLVVWFLCTRFPQKTAITAPTSGQLFDALWPEIGKWVKRLEKPLQERFEITGDRIRLKAAPEESFVSAKTSRAETPEAMAGVHSENVLLLFDEASGIPEPVFEAAAGSMSTANSITILTGNPTRSSGTFYDTHNLLPDWETLHVSCVDSPRVTQDFINDFKLKYGEDSNQYRVRVLGEFPLADEETVIPMSWIKDAAQREGSPDAFRAVSGVWGLDVSRSGSNKTVLLRRHGSTVLPNIMEWQGKNTMETCAVVVQEFQSIPHKPVEILVDSVGVGGGVADRLMELGLPVRAINVGESPMLRADEFVNLRAELWWTMREWFEQKNCSIPRHEKLVKELASVQLKPSARKIQIESKAEMKARGVDSPDYADALMLTFASTVGVALYGWNPVRNQPLKRAIAGIV